VADALVLIWVRLTQAPDIGRHLAEQLAVIAAQLQAERLAAGLRRLDLQIHAGGEQNLDRVRVPQRERGDLSLDFGAVADAMDLQVPGESRRTAVHGVGGQRARQTVQRGMFVAGPMDFERGPLLYDADAGRDGHRQLALGAGDFQLLADRNLDAARERNRLFTNSRHIETPLPDAAQNLSADALLVSVAAGHHAARGGQDVDAHTAQHARNIGLADIHAPAGTRNPLDGGNHRRVVGTVLEIDLDGLL